MKDFNKRYREMGSSRNTERYPLVIGMNQVRRREEFEKNYDGDWLKYQILSGCVRLLR
ncbi:MAG: hypothetical protein OEZ36_02735 [Spirochaetota bacterium]|nr:hypothetical protein [Spirochaetota bacterium]